MGGGGRHRFLLSSLNPCLPPTLKWYLKGEKTLKQLCLHSPLRKWSKISTPDPNPRLYTFSIGGDADLVSLDGGSVVNSNLAFVLYHWVWENGSWMGCWQLSMRMGIFPGVQFRLPAKTKSLPFSHYWAELYCNGLLLEQFWKGQCEKMLPSQQRTVWAGTILWKGYEWPYLYYSCVTHTHNLIWYCAQTTELFIPGHKENKRLHLHKQIYQLSRSFFSSITSFSCSRTPFGLPFVLYSGSS